jgi:hypothetical protein
MTEYERLILIAEARVARQQELVTSLEARRLDTTEAKSTLAGLRYNLRVLKDRQRRDDKQLTGLRRPAARRRQRSAGADLGN